jgi:phosphopantothenoylcysteine decarboxylase/phosphopantothenate--cysteine ligase
MTNLANKHILLGISSGIAAYKTPMLVRALRAAGAEVQVVMTPTAHKFVTATSLQAVSGRPVRQDLWDAAAEAAMGHIELARWADLVVIAPATANTIAKLAAGVADDLLTTLCLATAAPVVLAPAMNQQMYQHPATQDNLATLAGYGYQILGPAAGEQACGEEGPGRMVEPDEIVEYLAASSGLLNSIKVAETRDAPLAGRRVMITAGPTLEAIDPVRYISNHSSGKQGISLAEAALAAGAEVILIAGPRVPECNPGIQRIDVTSALDMQNAVHQNLSGVDIFIGVAAVADYRPAEAKAQKMKRSGAEQGSMVLELVENPDIIKSVAEHSDRPALVIGFAAETNDTHKHAREKLHKKGLDAVVVNDVSNPNIGFNSEQNAATLIYAQGEVVLPQQSKRQLSDTLVRQIPQIFASQLADTNPESMTK